ncbi:MAG: gliding motility-associated protein GldE, partial [Chitinophagaceae bacterium]|nr:gliding motility-associated protein GldE [Chitinophagaceae bacterium]
YKVDDDNYIFEGKIMVHDMCRIMKLPIDTFDKVKGESESLAGLILELAGELPTQDWVIPCGDFEFEIMKVENNRVQLVKVSIKQRTGNENE